MTMNEFRPRRRIARANRASVLFLVAGSLLGLSVWSLSSRHTDNLALPSFGPTTAAPVGAESSMYTCTGIWAGPPTPTLQLQLTNVTGSVRGARIEVVNAAGEHGLRSVTIKAGTTEVVPLGGLVPKGGDAAAFVTIDGGGVGVAEVSAISGNIDSAPCASSSSSSWYFAGGSTQEHDVMSVSLANPTSSTAVANLTFTTADGLIVPGDSQGVVIAPHGVASLTLNSMVPHRSTLGVIVSATKGSVVATASRSRAAPQGDSLVLGAPSLSPRLVLPGAVASAGATMTLTVSNPTTVDQKVTVLARIASGALSPWIQTVSAHCTWSLEVSPSSRVPLTSIVSLEVTSSGQGVNAELELLASKATSAGMSDAVLTDGSSFDAGRWLFAAASSDPASLVLTATSTSGATIHVARMSRSGPVPVSGLDGKHLVGGTSLAATAEQLATLGGFPLLIWSEGHLASTERLAGGALPDGVTTLYAEPLRP